VDPNATPLAISGSFTASADQTASAGTSASGDAQGSDAAVGLSLGLTIANHNSTATLERDLTAGGDVTISADGSSDSSANAHASAAGAPGESSGGASGSGVDDQVAQQRGFADTTSTSNGGHGTGGTGTPSASTSDGGVSVGAAVAINDAQIHNQAILPTNAVVTATNGATIAAVMGSTHEVGASAKSGAGGGSVSIAGSVAIDIVNIQTDALLFGTLTAGPTGDVNITATSHMTGATDA